MSNPDSPLKNLPPSPSEGGKLEDYLAVLEDHRRTCEREGNFLEAEQAKKRVEELRVQDGQRQVQGMILKQQEDKQQIEEAHTKEYQQFQQEWEQRIGDKDQENQIVMQQLEGRHHKELEDNRQLLEQRIPVVFKPSSELLNLKKIQEQLARQKEYGEAHKVQQKVAELEREEQEKYLQVRMKKIVAQETLLIQKQSNQMHALRKKCENAIKEDQRTRDAEHDKMLQRYANVKKELENQQNLERIKYEKLFGRQMLAAQSSLSYSQNKEQLFQSSKGFGSSAGSPRKTYNSNGSGKQYQ